MNGFVFAVGSRSFSRRKIVLSCLCFLRVAWLLVVLCGVSLGAAPSPIGTGLLSNISLGALAAPAKVNRAWPGTVNYDVDLSTWKYDVYVPVGYDGTKPYGVVVYTSSNSTGAVLSQAATDRNLIWIAPRNVQNSADFGNRFGASLLAFYRAKELFNIDPRRVYTSGLSGGARVASTLAFLHSELIRGTAPSSGLSLPRFNEVTPNYIPNTSTNLDSFYDYSTVFFASSDVSPVNASAITNKLRSYLITRYDDHREDYMVEAFHCAYEPQGLTAFLYDGPGGHHDASDAEMTDAIDYLDRNDTFPIDARSGNSFANLTNISQAGAQAANTTGQNSVKRLTPTLSAVAAVKSATALYWDNRNGSTFRWLWEVRSAAPQNQKTSFGVWFNGETWGGGPPNSLTAAANPGILVTITQTAAGNRIVISARPDSGGETVFYDGSFTFVPTYSTAQTSTQVGYLTSAVTGSSPVEMRLELNQTRFQITFNGIVLGTTSTIATGTQISRDNKRAIFGLWDTALGTPFWKHDPITSALNTWLPSTKAIFTASTGAVSPSGEVPAAMDLRYVLVSDPGLPLPPAPGPTGLTAVASFGEIELAWNALAGATSYQVKRATLPGGTATVLQSSLPGTAYTDTAAVPGTLYYYTVCANTAAGVTANTLEVPAGLSALLVRNSGGIPSASVQGTTETAAKAFDGSVNTKWFAASTTPWLQYQFASGKRWALSQYKIASANDVPARDPKSWQVQGSNDGLNWTVVDTRTNQSFANRFTTNTYTVSPTAEFGYYRLNITLNSGDVATQLSEWQLIGSDTIAPMIITPTNIVAAASGANGAVVTFSATATDSGDGALPAQLAPASGSLFPVGVTTVTATASDTSGNGASKTFTVSVIPTPAAALSIVSQVAFTGGIAQVRLASPVVGLSYQLQRSYTLAANSWVNVGAAQVGGATGLNFNDTPDPAQSRVFYRLLIGP